MADKPYIIHLSFHRRQICQGEQKVGILGPQPAMLPAGSGEISKLNMLGGTSMRDSTRAERVIEAEQPTIVSLIAVGGYWPSQFTCRIAVTFAPKANAEYELAHDIGDRTCFVQLNELSASADGSVLRAKVENVRAERFMCWF